MWKSGRRRKLDTMAEPQRGEVEHFIVSRRQIAFAFAILTVIFAGQGLWLGNLQRASHRQSVYARQKFAQTDLVLCAAFDRIRADDRATISDGPKTLAATLRLLGLDPKIAARVVALNQQEVKKELALRPALKCSQLPSAVAERGTSVRP